MKTLQDNLSHNIYPEVTEYLTGTESADQRFITEVTLHKFGVGVGEEKFFDEHDEQWKIYQCVYFPMFGKLSSKEARKKLESTKAQLKKLSVKEANIEKEALIQVLKVSDDE